MKLISAGNEIIRFTCLSFMKKQIKQKLSDIQNIDTNPYASYFYTCQNKIGHSSSSSSNQRSKETADQRCLLITILENGQ